MHVETAVDPDILHGQCPALLIQICVPLSKASQPLGSMFVINFTPCMFYIQVTLNLSLVRMTPDRLYTINGSLKTARRSVIIGAWLSTP